MAEAKLQFLLDLEDRVSPGMQKVQSSLENFKGKVEDMAPAFKTMAAVGTAGFAAITGAVGLSVKAYADSEAQLARVDAIMNTLSTKTLAQFSGGAKQASQIAREFGTELQNLGGIGDEAAAEGFAKLLQITGDSSKAMDAASAAADLATFKQIDYASAVDIVGKVMSGNTSILTRYGIQLKDGATAEEAMAELTKRTAGQYEAYGKTIAGQTEILHQKFGDLQENIGAAFIPVMTKLFESIQPIIDKVVAWTAANPKLLAVILAVSAGIFGLIAAVGVIGLAIPGLITGFTALATAASFLGGAILSITWPVALVVAGIAALIAIGVLLYKHWDDVSAFASSTWETIRTTITGAMQAVGDFLSAMWETIKNVFWTAVNFIIGAFAMLFDYLLPGWDTALVSMWAKAVEIFTSIKAFFAETFTALHDNVSSVLDTISEKWSAIWNGMKDVFTDIWNAIAAVFDSIVDGISSAMSKLVGPIQRVIDLAQRALDLAGGAVKSVGGAISSGISSIISRGSSLTGKAIGGPVLGGTPYMVGEKGPELFIPGQSGTIIPNGRLAGGPNISVVITGNTLLDRDAARKIGDEMVRYLKDNLRV